MKQKIPNNITIKKFKNLPNNVRERMTDLKGNKINVDDIDPNALVCVEVTN